MKTKQQNLTFFINHSEKGVQYFFPKTNLFCEPCMQAIKSCKLVVTSGIRNKSSFTGAPIESVFFIFAN